MNNNLKYIKLVLLHQAFTKYKGYEVNDLKNRYELPIDTILELGNYNE